MILGFTGTRNGMTIAQRMSLAPLLDLFDELHHGDCIGADKQCHDLWGSRGRTVGHPSDLSQRAFCKFDELLPEKSPLFRNHDIVDICDILIACPAGEETVRSGTWATLRYAKKTRKPYIVIYPEGGMIAGK